MFRFLLTAHKKGFYTALIIISTQMITSTSSVADLLAVGEKNSPSHKLGFAISSLITLKSPSETLYFRPFLAGDKHDELKILLDRVSDFALIDQAVAAFYDDEDTWKNIRGLARFQHPLKPRLLLVPHVDVAEEDVYNVTKVIFDNRKTLADLYEAAAGIEPYRATGGHPFPIHSGALRYHKESNSLNVPESLNPSLKGLTATELRTQLDSIGLERNELIDELKLHRIHQQSMANRLRDALQREALTRKRHADLQRKLEQAGKIIAEREQQLEVIVSDREKIGEELSLAKQQLDNIEFRELAEANQVARAMRGKADETEARYQEAFGIARACLQTQSGGKSTAIQALAQIERLEAEVEALGHAHQACLAGSGDSLSK